MFFFPLYSSFFTLSLCLCLCLSGLSVCLSVSLSLSLSLCVCVCTELYFDIMRLFYWLKTSTNLNDYPPKMTMFVDFQGRAVKTVIGRDLQSSSRSGECLWNGHKKPPRALLYFSGELSTGKVYIYMTCLFKGWPSTSKVYLFISKESLLHAKFYITQLAYH